jgi:hypothetical protein
VEATAFKDSIVIVQVNELVDELPRVDIPGSWVDIVVEADRPYQLEALFTRDPRHITELHIFIAMLTIRGVYEKHRVQTLNHGIGFNTAAIELLLPPAPARNCGRYIACGARQGCVAASSPVIGFTPVRFGLAASGGLLCTRQLRAVSAWLTALEAHDAELLLADAPVFLCPHEAAIYR